MNACPHFPEQRQILVSSEMGQETGCHVDVSCSTMSCVLVFELKADAAIKASMATSLSGLPAMFSNSGAALVMAIRASGKKNIWFSSQNQNVSIRVILCLRTRKLQETLFKTLSSDLSLGVSLLISLFPHLFLLSLPLLPKVYVGLG